MEVRFTGKHISVTAGMREHMKEKLQKLGRYSPRLIEAQVLIKKEKYIYYAEVTVLARHLRAYGEGRAKDNVYTAMDLASERIEKQLKKFREKTKDHRKKRGPARLLAAEDETPAAGGEDAEARPAIIVQKPETLKSIMPEEASVQLENSNKRFLVFLNLLTRKINIIFKREDGNHGLMEPGS